MKAYGTPARGPFTFAFAFPTLAQVGRRLKCAARRRHEMQEKHVLYTINGEPIFSRQRCSCCGTYQDVLLTRLTRYPQTARRAAAPRKIVVVCADGEVVRNG